MNHKELNFEQAMKELEETVRNMEKGDLPLDDLLADFEKGIGLLRLCEKKLAEAEGRIAVLTREEIDAAKETTEVAVEEASEMLFGESELTEDELPF